METKSYRIPRLMIAAAGSGSGKTTVTCGLLQALLFRGVSLCSFKCGPDYIDPMFHTEVLGIPSRNLDLFFTDGDTARFLLGRAAASAFGRDRAGTDRPRLAVMEGVMGYYDGLAAISTEASSYHLARATETPVVLLVDCKGKSVSILAEIKGFQEYRKDSGIKGVLLNRLPAALYGDMKEMIERELGLKVYGYLPQMKGCGLESRHLGLVTAKEVGNLKDILSKVAAQTEETVDLEGLLALGREAPPITFPQAKEPGGDAEEEEEGEAAARPVRIGVARDKAFCFYYQDNLDLLESLGAELVFFSPLEDPELPLGLSGLIFGGGYPELYLKRLSENERMREEIRRAIAEGIPCIAECGGFMYLHRWILDEEGRRWPMAGAVEGESFPTGKLGRFGYIALTARKDTLLCLKGGVLRGHEFHYWDSTNTGDSFTAKKPLRSRSWDCVLTGKGNLFAGYPHVHFYSNPRAGRRFVEACRAYGCGK